VQRGGIIRHAEVDDKPPAVAARRILGLVHHGRAQQYDIIGLQGVIVALDEM
jgi:hypothetical protein